MIEPYIEALGDSMDDEAGYLRDFISMYPVTFKMQLGYLFFLAG